MSKTTKEDILIVAFAAYLFTPLAALLIEKIPVVRYLILGIRH